MATLAHYVIQFTKSQPNSAEEAIKDREQLRLDFEMLFEVSITTLISSDKEARLATNTVRPLI